MPGASSGGAVTDRGLGDETSFLKQSFDGLDNEAADCSTDIPRQQLRRPHLNGSPVLQTGHNSGLEEEPLESASRTKSSDAAADAPSSPPLRISRMRSNSLPDISKPASPGLPGAVACKRSDEVALMRKALAARGYPEHAAVFTDAYIMTVMAAHKNGKQRTFDYALDKLAESLKWRRDYGAPAVTANDVHQSLAPGHMYWHGRDAEGRPILWVRPALMDLGTYDRDNYLKAHVFLLEQGLELMRGEVTCFVLVADSTGLSQKHMDSKLMRELLKVAQVAYPDRLGALVVGPVNMIVRGSWVLLSRLMSKRLAEKISLVQSPRAHLTALLPSTAEIPEWLA